MTLPRPVKPILNVNPKVGLWESVRVEGYSKYPDCLFIVNVDLRKYLSVRSFDFVYTQKPLLIGPLTRLKVKRRVVFNFCFKDSSTFFLLYVV